MTSTITINIKAVADGVKSVIQGVVNTVNDSVQAARSFNEQLEQGKSAAQQLMEKVAVVFSVAAFAGMVREAQAARQGIAQLNAALRSTGQATDEYSRQLEAQREELSKVTSADDDLLVKVQTLLVSFGASKDQIGALTQLTLDLAAATGTDATSAAQQLGLALSGQEVRFRGMRLEIDSSLSKVDQIGQAMAQLQSRFGGQAKAAFAEGGAEIITFGKTVDDLKKTIGGLAIDSVLAPMLNTVNQALQAALEWLSRFNREWPNLTFWIQKASEAFGYLVIVLGAIIAPFLAISVAIAGITTAISFMAPAVNLGVAALGTLAGINLAGAVSSAASLAEKINLIKVGAIAAAPALASLSLSLAGLVTILWAGAEAWRAWNAKKQEALSQANFAHIQDRLVRTIESEIELQEATRQLSGENAKALREQLAKAQQMLPTENERRLLLSQITAELLKQNPAKQEQIEITKALTDAEKQLHAAIAKRKEAEEDRDLKVGQALRSKELDETKSKYDSEEITLQEYNTRRKQLIQENLEEEKAITIRRMEDTQREIDQVSQRKQSPARDTELNNLMAQKETYVKEMAVLEINARRDIEQVDAEGRKKEREDSQKEIEECNQAAQAYLETEKQKHQQAAQDRIAIAESSGQKLVASEMRIRDQFAQIRKNQEGLDKTDADFIDPAQINRAEQMALAQARIGDETDKASMAQRAYQTELQTTHALLESGQITAAEAQARNKEAGQAYLGVLRDQLATVQQLAAENPGLTEASSQVAELQAKMAELSNTTKKLSFKQQLAGELGPWMADFGNKAKQTADLIKNTVGGAIDGLSSGLTQAIMGTKSLGDAMKEMAVNLVSSFIQNIIKMALMALLYIPLFTLLNVLTGGAIAASGTSVTAVAIGAAAGMSSSAVGRYAQGGPVRGAGGPKDDKIPAWLSNGEYIVPAETVARVGVPFLDSLKSFKLPAFANGGLVKVGVPQINLSAIENVKSLKQSSVKEISTVTQQQAQQPTINLEPTPVEVVVLNNTNQVKQFMESRAGRAIIIDAIKGARLDLGIV